jgi:hypothetical protein
MKVCFESTSGPSEKARFVKSWITKYKEIEARDSLSIFTLQIICLYVILNQLKIRKQLYNILLSKYMFRPMAMLRGGEQMVDIYMFDCWLIFIILAFVTCEEKWTF